MSAGLETHLGGPINGPSFADRAGNLAPAQRVLYKRLLASLIEGNAPWLDPLPEAAAPLIDADLIQAYEDGRLAVAYPFSVQPTRHRVTLSDGRSYHAMCAIDALGIPQMLGERGKVQAREPDGEQIVRVTIDPVGEATWIPAPAVAVVAFGDGSCLAQSACPHLNLFAGPDAAARYLDTNGMQGSVLSIADAALAGRWLFGDLLRALGDIEDQ